MSDQQWISFAEFTAQLKQLCEQQLSGTLLGITAENASLAVVLDRGGIVGLSLKTTVGAKALPLFASLDSCKAGFKPGLIMRRDSDLPATETILQRLGSDSSNIQSATASMTSPVTFSSTTTETSSDTLANRRLIAIIEKQASSLFGPVAKLLLQEQLAAGHGVNAPDRLRALLHAIARAAGEPALAKQLIANTVTAAGLEQRSIIERG